MTLEEIKALIQTINAIREMTIDNAAKILGIERGTELTKELVSQQYRRSCLLLHPDKLPVDSLKDETALQLKQGADTAFKKLCDAKDFLLKTLGPSLATPHDPYAPDNVDKFIARHVGRITPAKAREILGLSGSANPEEIQNKYEQLWSDFSEAQLKYKPTAPPTIRKQYVTRYSPVAHAYNAAKCLLDEAIAILVPQQDLTEKNRDSRVYYQRIDNLYRLRLNNITQVPANFCGKTFDCLTEEYAEIGASLNLTYHAQVGCCHFWQLPVEDQKMLRDRHILYIGYSRWQSIIFKENSTLDILSFCSTNCFNADFTNLQFQCLVFNHTLIDGAKFNLMSFDKIQLCDQVPDETILSFRYEASPGNFRMITVSIQELVQEFEKLYEQKFQSGLAAFFRKDADNVVLQARATHPGILAITADAAQLSITDTPSKAHPLAIMDHAPAAASRALTIEQALRFSVIAAQRLKTYVQHANVTRGPNKDQKCRTYDCLIQACENLYAQKQASLAATAIENRKPPRGLLS